MPRLAQRQEIMVINPAGNGTICTYVLRAGKVLLQPQDVRPGEVANRIINWRDGIVVVCAPEALPVQELAK